MTDLLSSVTGRPTGPGRGTGRGVAVSAVLAAGGAAALVLLPLVALALAGWFAADAGRYGETTDAVRVGAAAWLLAHGAGLRLDGATVTVAPLAVTLHSAAAAFRAGRWAVRRSGAADLRSALGAASVIAAAYGVLALLVAIGTTDPAAESDLGRAFLGGATLMLVLGGAGALTGSGAARSLAGTAPAWAVSAATGAAGVLLLLLAAGAALVAAALVLDFGEAATVLSRLHADGPGGLMYTLVGVGFVPNAVALGGAYLLGPGFMVGTGTVISPTAVVLGPVPSFPLLAALPADGATPPWATGLVAVPVLLAAVGAFLAGRVRPESRYEVGAACGLAAGLLAAVGFTLIALLAGGAAGPGRMADVGVEGPGLLLAALTSLGAGGLLGGGAATLVTRRGPTEPRPRPGPGRTEPVRPR